MGKLKIMKGDEVVRIFEIHDFYISRTVGSHVRMTALIDGVSYHVTIPRHAPLKKGTLASIVKTFQSIFGKEIAEKYFNHQ